jgi:hypothetical protein
MSATHLQKLTEHLRKWEIARIKQGVLNRGREERRERMGVAETKE